MRQTSVYLVAGTFLTTFGSSMLFGYNIAIFNLPDKHVKQFLTMQGDNSSNQSSKETVLYSVATSIFLVGGLIGAVLSGVLADKIGRKKGLIVNNVVMILGAVLFLIARGISQPALIYVARAIVGISSGITQGLASMYLTEIAPISRRGSFGAAHQLASTVGIALSNLLTFEQILGTNRSWMIASGLVGAPALVQAAFQWFLPDSPRYLHLKGYPEEARTAYIKYHPHDPEAREFVREMEEQDREPEFHFTQIVSRQYSRPMLVACLTQVLSQFSAINAMRSYSKEIMTTAGVQRNVVQFCVFGVSVFSMVCTAAGLPLLELCGRRPLLLYSTAGVVLCLVGLGVSVQIQEIQAQSNSNGRAASYTAIVFIFLHSGVFSVGLGNLEALVVSELFEQRPRGAAFSISQAVRWMGNLAVVLIYPNVQKQLHGIIFFLFLIFEVPIFILFVFIMPEMKHRSVEEISHEMETSFIQWHPLKRFLHRKTAPTEQELSDKVQDTNNAHSMSYDQV